MNTEAPRTSRRRYRATSTLVAAALGLGVVALNPGVGDAVAAKAGNDGRNNYQWMMDSRGTDPKFVARWNRCEPIRWGIDTVMLGKQRINVAKELKRWKGIFNEAARVSGYTFVYTGRVDGQAGLEKSRFNSDGYRSIVSSAYDANGGIDIAITNAIGKGGGKYNVPLFRSGSPAGLGGFSAGSGSDIVFTDGTSGGSRASNGNVIINTKSVKDAIKRKRTRGQVRQLYLHELGHALGLNHVKDRRQAMYPSMSASQVYGAGDRTGLRLLGSSMCFKPVPPEPEQTWDDEDWDDDELATRRGHPTNDHDRVNITWID